MDDGGHGSEKAFSDCAENENSDNSYISENEESQSDTSESEHSENQNKNKITLQTNKKSILKKSAAAAGVNLTEKTRSKTEKKSVNFQEEGNFFNFFIMKVQENLS